MQLKEYGLIGKSLKHSYSKIIHGKFAKYGYDLIEIAPEELQDFAQKKELKGYNVTIPYKKQIIPYLDFVSEEAKYIGAVNTVVNKKGLLYGYNTDFLGLEYLLKRVGISLENKTVMILGTGGASSTATAVCQKQRAKEIITVSRSGEVNYNNCYEFQNVQVIINTTPVGTYPNTNESPLDLTKFSNLESVVDVVYNPALTKLLFEAKKLKLKTANGLAMLVAQAKYAMDYFLGYISDDSVIDKITMEMQRDMQNIVLIGMPSSGKSSIGERVARLLDREFIDIDVEIEKSEGKSIPEIFAEYGEEYFRKLEKQITLKVCSLSGKVISTGGGVVKDIDNLFSLKQNGKVILISRGIDKLVCDGRPLSKDKGTIKKLYEQRKDLYELFADDKVFNDGELEDAVQGVIKAYENLSN